MVGVDDRSILCRGDVVGVGIARRERLDEVLVGVWDAEEELEEAVVGVGVEVLGEAAAHGSDEPIEIIPNE